MRAGVIRGLTGAVLAGVTLLAASACAGRDLTAQWPAMAAPTGWEPRAGTCHSSFEEVSHRAAYRPVECTASHGYETTHIGTFSGAVAAAGKPPARAELAAAWAECDAKTTEYLGGPWRDANVWIGVSVPSPGGWTGGARWFRCEAGATTYQIGDLINYSKSLKGVLAGQSELKRGCYQIPADEEADWAPVPCTTRHNAEFVGTFLSTDTHEQLQANLPSAHQRCRSLIARYVGVPDDGNMRYRSGSYYSFPSKRDWDDGDRGVRCHLWMSDKQLTASVKGGGNQALPK